ALIKIANIVAVCFTALVAVICLLNLYNSVGGRHLAILKEQAVLRSMGMTKLQEIKILILENARMLFTAILCSSVISAAFTIVLHRLLSAWVGKLIFHLPVGVILLTLSVCVVSLVLFSIICYHKSPEASISEELRNENA
ncbi:MAG: FtsX-like permease family protein, partial [Lachnospiraceae bacterium]|nr:FtsX-like permease family protein [Lachnospiraceae bacterium]